MMNLIPSPPRRIWLALEAAEIIEMKQIVLDRDAAGAAAFFHRVVAPRVEEVARRRGILPDAAEDEAKDERLSG